jgi:hypothetical protein
MYLITVFILYQEDTLMLTLQQRYDEELDNDNEDYTLPLFDDKEYQDTLFLLAEHNHNILMANLPSIEVEYINDIIIH